MHSYIQKIVTANSIRQVEAQEKKELSKQQNNFGKQLIPKGKSSTSSVKV
jgi:hypothetical protein